MIWSQTCKYLSQSMFKKPLMTVGTAPAVTAAVSYPIN